MSAPASLEALIDAEALTPVAPAVAAIVEAARGRFGDAAVAVLFYGSCLREADDAGKLVDLYVLVDDYARAWGGGLAAVANRLLPPSVLYLETPFAGRRVRAKVAVMTLDAFERAASPAWFQSYIWARFAQPCRLAWSRDEAARRRALAALASAARTAVAAVLPLLPPRFEALAPWRAIVRASYRSELRVERLSRADELVGYFQPHYRQATACLAAEGLLAALPGGEYAAVHPRPGGWRWPLRGALGKTLSGLRLAKAAFTFADGASYIAWKIERHSGVRLELTPWQRRHPLLASPLLFWRLWRRGAVR